MANTSKPTVWHVFYDLLRHYEMRTMFGNPGSTEQPMLKNFPKDFQYVLGLQEASVVAMADGYSQATRKPVAVSLHTSAGTGNAMSSIATAFMNKTPLVLVAGQQTREMLIGDPLLGNRGPESMVQPFIKWAYQPVRAVDVPAALIRAVATAMLPPSGPVYLSIPLDDWDVEALPPPIPRAVSTRTSPDPAQLSAFAARIEKAKRMAIVFGAEVDKSLGWPAAISLAEQLNAPVFLSPLCDRASFPETHKLFKGPLPPARGPLSKKLEGHDLVLVVGAEVWRFVIPGCTSLCIVRLIVSCFADITPTLKVLSCRQERSSCISPMTHMTPRLPSLASACFRTPNWRLRRLAKRSNLPVHPSTTMGDTNPSSRKLSRTLHRTPRVKLPS